VRYFKGQPTFVSAKAEGVVQVAMPPPSKGKRVGIVVIGLNRGGRPRSLGYENIAIRTSAGLPVTLLTYEELQHKARVKAGWMTFFAAVAAGANSYAAQQSAYGTAHGSAYTSTPYGGIRSSYSASYYSPRLPPKSGRRAPTLRTQRCSVRWPTSSTRRWRNSTVSVLRTTTIDPGRNRSAGGGARLAQGREYPGLGRDCQVCRRRSRGSAQR
jgi:hypothetical protein